MIEDARKTPKKIFEIIRVLLNLGRPIFEAYTIICKVFGDDVMGYGDFDFWWYRFSNGECDLDYDRSKESKKRELGDMPIKIVKKIIENLENEERYVLPNVSKGIRNVMEESNLLISSLRLEVYSDLIDISFNSRKAQFEHSWYRTLVRIGDTKRMVEGDHLTVAMNQFTRILNDPKLRFDTLTVVFEWEREDMNSFKTQQNFNAVQKAFQSITNQIHVKTLLISINSSNQLMTILPYLKPGVLETIGIYASLGLAGIGNYLDSEQFKQAKSFFSIGFFFDAPIEKLLHLNAFVVTLRTISIEDVIRIKDAFLASPNLKKCFIHQENVDNLRLLEDFDGKVFGIPGSKDSIRIEVAQFNVSIDRVSNN